MTEKGINQIVEKQRHYYRTGTTIPVEFRIKMLKRLKSAILAREDEIHAALKADLGKSAVEAYMCETGMALEELSHMISHTRKFAKNKRVATPIAQFAARSYQSPIPYGTVLIMSPWNYPFLLTIGPLIDAIAAGNTAVIKPSAYAEATSKVIKNLILDHFPPEYLYVVTGGREENQALLKEHFDYIFFTGGKTVGRQVLRMAAEYLTPVTLELGGKSPCIVDSTAKIPLAAKRIVFGKYLNCGQTCVAPDYIYCHSSVMDELVAEIKRQIVKQFGKDPLANKDYGKIINQKHFTRLLGLIDSNKLVHGGRSNPETLQIEPTVLDGVTWKDAVMQEEIFGPILPILTFDKLDQAIEQINEFDRPLALYLFTESKKTQGRILRGCTFGGGCINDTIIHLATTNMGFGGVSESGMGTYHGKAGFDTFSHYRSIVDKKTFIDLPMRYQPYTSFHDKLIRKFLK